MEWLHCIREALDRHPARIIEPGVRAHAAVAMILEDQPEGPRVLFIERSANANDYWSGQICFPGGRAENCDTSPRHTAERETCEELGLDLATAHYVGRLNDISPGSLKIVVSCFVYVVTQHPLLSPDDREVADAFWVPVREFNNPARRAHVDVPVRGRRCVIYTRS
jgi:8-oxo-dGTP pyrophosphatase MutT (NUDIX family)